MSSLAQQHVKTAFLLPEFTEFNPVGHLGIYYPSSSIAVSP